MVEGDRARAWGARLLAPLAFFAAATLLVLVVQNSIESDEAASSTTRVTGTIASVAATETSSVESAPATTEPVAKEFYRIKQGDTLESIAARFDVGVDDLRKLNPGIDPIALRPGQRIRVR